MGMDDDNEPQPSRHMLLDTFRRPKTIVEFFG